MEQIINFYNDKIVAKVLNGKIYVAITPICRNLGLDNKKQIKALKEDVSFSKDLIFIEVQPPQPPKSPENILSEVAEQLPQIDVFEEFNEAEVAEKIGQTRKMWFISLKKVLGWLYSIKITNTMKPETQEKILLYKDEIDEVLNDYFFGATKNILKNVSLINQLLPEKEALQAEEKFVKKRIKEIDAQLSRLNYNNQSLERQTYRQLELAF